MDVAGDLERSERPYTTCGVNLVCENCRVRFEGVFIEQDSKVRIASGHKELIRDVRDVITTTGSGDNVSRFSARWAWIPLKEGKAKLMLHKVTVGGINVTKPVRFGMAKSDHGEYQGARLWKRTSSCTENCVGKIVSSHQSSTSTSLAGSG